MKCLISKMNVAIVAAVLLFTSGAVFANETDPSVEAISASIEAIDPSVEAPGLVEATTGTGKAPDVIRKEMNVSGYQLVKVNGNFKVYLKQGEQQKIVVEADESLVPEVKHFIVDNTLNIYTSDDVKKRITLWITLKDINNLNKYGNVRVIKER